MVSETLRLTIEERGTLAARLVQIAAGRGPVFVSVGAESIQQAVAFARQAQDAGCNAVMAMPPTLTALTSDALLEYFQSLAESVQIPLIVQDASSYVGQSIPLSVQVELLRRFDPQKVLFKPEAAPLGPTISALRDATTGEARIFEGSGGILLIDSYRRGVAGTMPGMDLLDGIVAIWRALLRGDEETAYRVHGPVAAIVSLQMQAGLDGFLAIDKYILARRGVIQYPFRRRPFRWELDDETAAEVDRLLLRLQTALTNFGRTNMKYSQPVLESDARFTDLQPPRATRVRYVVLAWLCAAATIAYTCRQSIGVAESTIRWEVGLSKTQMGLIMSVFFWSYGIGQIPGGWLGHRYGSRRMLPLLSIVWSLATGAASLAVGMPLFVVRASSTALRKRACFRRPSIQSRAGFRRTSTPSPTARSACSWVSAVPSARR